MNNGSILDCSTDVAIQTSGQRVGGITGNHTVGGLLSGCSNFGDISSSYDAYANTVNMGGIAGQSGGAIENCYNMGDVTATGGNHNGGVGGIVGVNQTSGTISNQYNVGGVGYTYDPDNRPGNAEVNQATGATAESSDGTVENSFYRKDACTNGIGSGITDGVSAKSEAQLKTKQTVVALNKGGVDGPFYMDSQMQNNGYPLLKWQGGTPPIVSNDEEAVATDKAMLTLPQFSYIEAGTIVLPSGGAKGSAILWESDHTEIIDTAGIINLPNEGVTTVSLTATLKKGAIVDQKSHLFYQSVC